MRHHHYHHHHHHHHAVTGRRNQPEKETRAEEANRPFNRLTSQDYVGSQPWSAERGQKHKYLVLSGLLLTSWRSVPAPATTACPSVLFPLLFPNATPYIARYDGQSTYYVSTTAKTTTTIHHTPPTTGSLALCRVRGATPGYSSPDRSRALGLCERTSTGTTLRRCCISATSTCVRGPVSRTTSVRERTWPAWSNKQCLGSRPLPGWYGSTSHTTYSSSYSSGSSPSVPLL